MDQTITFTANVSVTSGTATPTGSVVFTSNGSQIATCSLTSGSCTATYSWSVIGTYSIVANYSASGAFIDSSSSALSQVINRRATSSTVDSNNSPAILGQPIVHTVRVVSTLGTGPAITGTAILHAYLTDTVIGNCTVVAGTCQINLVASTVGHHRIWIEYTGNATDYAPSNSPYVYQDNVAKPTPSVVVTTTPTSPTDFGTAVTIQATVSGSNGTPTGVITFKEGGTNIAQCTLNGSGTCSAALNSLSAASHTLTAVFGEDTNYSGAEGSVTHVVNAVVVSTTTTLQSSANPAISGHAVTFTATVSASGGTPTGSVKFSNGATEIATCTLNGSGSCTVTTDALPVGSLTINANYLGAPLFNTSSTSISQTISDPTTKITTTLLTASDTATVGSVITLTATVTNLIQVTGEVSFKDGETSIGTCTLSTGSCQITVTPNIVGVHIYSANYLGTADFDPSSASKSVTVAKKNANLRVTADKNPAPRINPVVFTVTLDSSATGSITVIDGSNPIQGCASLTGGSCSITEHFAELGTHNLHFNYLGDDQHSGATFDLDLVVGSVIPTVTVTSSAVTVEYGVAITFTATLSESAASGTINFSEGGTGIGSCVISSGACSITISNLNVATHSITAVYSGDSQNAGVTSPDFIQLVTLSNTTTTIATTSNPFEYGSGLVITATVINQGTGPTGTVQFEDVTTSPTVILGTCVLVGRTCFITLDTSLTIGTHTIAAEYTSDGNYAGSRSANITQVITAPTAAVAVISSDSVVNSGDAITFTINRIAQDSVTITNLNGEIDVPYFLNIEGGNNPGGALTYNMLSGTCTLSTNRLDAASPGTCVISVTLAGNRNYLPATSDSMTVSIRNYTRYTIIIPSNPNTGITLGHVTQIESGTVLAPVITLITPDSGRVGDLVVITGSHFTGATRVIFNVFYDSANFNVDSDTQITAEIPVGVTPTALDGVDVITPGGPSMRFYDFTILP